ncbi:unnamed protein product [Plutella xylostella]|uniref:(diamondback moth) hypothetical protein n=1 Tax=Plutella xylostella TaxID=51655 RepID=A0A8S4DKV9_PLUXY|nr:unnamed protein product [Plutella xylostella]
MANTVRKVKRGKAKEFTNYVQPPCIVVSPPPPAAPATPASSAAEMKVAATHTEVKNINVVMANNKENAVDSHDAPSTSQTNPHDNNINFNVNQLIAELSQNSRASKGEIENIQRKLLQQANEILKVNAFANPQPPGPRIIDSTQKYSSTAPGYGRIPVIVPRMSTLQGSSANQDNHNVDVSRHPPHSTAARDNQLGDTQLVPERLQEAPGTLAAASMINGGQGNMQRVAMSEGRGSFFYETGLSAAAAAAGASPRDAPRRGECLHVPFTNSEFFILNLKLLSGRAGVLFVFVACAFIW